MSFERLERRIAADPLEQIEGFARAIEARGRRALRRFPEMDGPYRLAGVFGQAIAVVLAADQIGDAVAVEVGEVDGAPFAGEDRWRRRGVEREGPGNAGVVHPECAVGLADVRVVLQIDRVGDAGGHDEDVDV